MKSFRVKAWFRAMPKPAVVDLERFERIGAKNMEKLTRASLKNKTAIQIITNEENVKNIINKNLKY